MSTNVLFFLIIIVIVCRGQRQRSYRKCEWNFDCISCIESSSQCVWSVSEHPYSPIFTLDPERTFLCSNLSESVFLNLNINGTAQADSRLRNYPKSLIVERMYSKTTVVEFCDAVNRDYQVSSYCICNCLLVPAFALHSS